MKILDFYKLQELPFSNAPDPRYLYASSTHREALASLLHGVKSGCGSPRADTISICTEGWQPHSRAFAADSPLQSVSCGSRPYPG
jgi:hypothetical protein